MKRYSQMTKEELEQEIKRLEQEEKQARQKSLESEALILRQKRNIARSYLIDPSAISPGKKYHVEGYAGLFTVEYVNGIMAWGTWEGSTEKVAYPLALLMEQNEKSYS